MSIPRRFLEAIRAASRLFAAMAVAGGTLTQAATSPYAVIITGSGGQPEYENHFLDWSQRLHTALVERLGFDPGAVFALLDPPAGEAVPDGAVAISRDAIGEIFEDLAARSTAEDDVFVFIIGHGTHQNRESKLIMPGPDLTAGDLAAHLDRLESRYQTVINSASSSAGFINVLSRPNRIICTATRSVEERNATEFMEHFLTGIEDGSADLNRDDRISVLEACGHAAALTQAAYTAQRLIQSEHAILDDNGDGLGTRLPISLQGIKGEGAEPAEDEDGALASRVFLREYRFPELAPEDLVQAYLDALDAIHEWKSRKDTMEEGPYYRGLEALLLDAARTNFQIRAFENTAPPAGAESADRENL